MHPAEDPRLKERHSSYTDNPANDPDFIFDLMDRCEEDPATREAVHDCFFDGDLGFLFHDGQKQIMDVLKKDAAEFLVLCSRQLGKSFAILCLAIMHCAKMQGRRRPLVRIFCQTQRQIDEIVQDNMALIEALAPPGFIKRTKSDNRYYVGFGQIRLAMISAAHVHGRRGGNATLVIIEEGGFSPTDTYQVAVQSVIGPQLLRSEGKLIHVTTSSEDNLHYIHSAVQPKCDLAGTLVNLTIYHNPQLSDRQIIKAWDLIYDGTTEQWDREYLCLVVASFARSVMPEFNEDLIVFEDFHIPNYAHWMTGLDFGGVKDKHGILLAYWNFDLNCLDVVDELLLPINTSTEVIRKKSLKLEKKHLTEASKDLYTVASHRRISDNPGQIQVDLAAVKFNVTTPDKPAGSWEANINEVRKSAVQGRLRIHSRCKMLIATLKYGKFNKQRTDFERTAELGHLDLFATLGYIWRHKDESNPYPLLPAGYSRDTHYADRKAMAERKNKLGKMMGKDR